MLVFGFEVRGYVCWYLVVELVDTCASIWVLSSWIRVIVCGF